MRWEQRIFEFIRVAFDLPVVSSLHRGSVVGLWFMPAVISSEFLSPASVEQTSTTLKLSKLVSVDCVCRTGGVGGSVQTVQQRKVGELRIRDDTTWQRAIKKLGQEQIDKIRDNWVAMDTVQSGRE